MGFDELWVMLTEMYAGEAKPEETALDTIIGGLAKEFGDDAVDRGLINNVYRVPSFIKDSEGKDIVNPERNKATNSPREYVKARNPHKEIAALLYSNFGGVKLNDVNYGGSKRKRRNRTNRLYKKRRNTKRRNTKRRNTKRRNTKRRNTKRKNNKRKNTKRRV